MSDLMLIQRCVFSWVSETGFETSNLTLIQSCMFSWLSKIIGQSVTTNDPIYVVVVVIVYENSKG